MQICTSKSHRDDQDHLLTTNDASSMKSYQSLTAQPPVTATDGKGYTHDDLGVSLNVLTVCVCIGACLPSLDTSVVYTTMNRIGTEFGSSNQIAWILSIYTLCSLITLTICGKMSDIVGRRPVLITLTTLFLLGSAGCGYASNLPQMILARAVAGLGGGGLILMSNVVLHDVVPVENRNRYLSYASTVQTLGFALGSPIGGYISDTLGWRYCFKINILPLFLILLVYIFRLTNYALPSERSSVRSIDFLGIFLLALGNVMVATTFLMGGNVKAWSDPFVIATSTTAVGALLLFGLYQRYWAGKYPLIPRSVRSNRNVVISCIVCFLTGAAETAFMFMIPQFGLGVVHLSGAQAGTLIMIEGGTCPLGCFMTGKIINRTGRFYRHLLASVLLYALVLMCETEWMATQLPFSVGYALVALQGYLYGAILVLLFSAVASDIAAEDVASAMSMLMISRYMGYMTGAAAASAVVQSTLKIVLSANLSGPDAKELIEFIRKSIGKVYTLAPEVQALVARALIEAFERAGLLMTLTPALAFLAVILMRDKSVSRS